MRKKFFFRLKYTKKNNKKQFIYKDRPQAKCQDLVTNKIQKQI